MRVLGLDSAMRHTGHVTLDFDPGAIIPLQTPHSTHPLMHLTKGGTINYDDTDDPRLERMICNAAEVHVLATEQRPDIVVIEGALDKGQSRSSTGTAIYALIMAPWHPARNKRVDALTLNPDLYIPPVVITISPERHMSMAHQKRKLTGTEKVKKYREMAAETPKGRVSEHQADAYFLAYHGVRFWLTMRDIWPKSILNPNEMAIFHDTTHRHPTSNRRLASKSMKDEEGRSWWEVVSPIEHVPAWVGGEPTVVGGQL